MNRKKNHNGLDLKTNELQGYEARIGDGVTYIREEDET